MLGAVALPAPAGDGEDGDTQPQLAAPPGHDGDVVCPAPGRQVRGRGAVLQDVLMQGMFAGRAESPGVQLCFGAQSCCGLGHGLVGFLRRMVLHETMVKGGKNIANAFPWFMWCVNPGRTKAPRPARSLGWFTQASGASRNQS